MTFSKPNRKSAVLLNISFHAWGEFPLGGVGSRAGGDNRKRAHSAQRRVGPKARPTDSAPAAGSPGMVIRFRKFGCLAS